MKKWNTGCSKRNKYEIIVWINGEEFMSFWTPRRILNDALLLYLYIQPKFYYPRLFMSNLWSFQIYENSEFSETSYFKHIHTFKRIQFYLYCSFRIFGQIQSVSKEKTYVWAYHFSETSCISINIASFNISSILISTYW